MNSVSSENNANPCLQRKPVDLSTDRHSGRSFSAEDIGADPDLWLYRDRTVALLRRYFRISIEVGRLPSILGRELFRSKVTAYRMSSFEDAVIFVHDVERALDRLSDFPRQLVAAVVFHEYTQEEAAAAFCCTRRTICREYPIAVDHISEIFLQGGLLNWLPQPVEKSCQAGKNSRFSVTDCNHTE
jgi:hypothetical protein